MSYQFFKSNNYKIEFPKNFNLDKETITELNLPEWNGTDWLPITLNFKDSIDTETQSKIYELIKNKSYFFVFYIHLKNNTQQYKTWEISVNSINKVFFGSCYYTSDSINICSVEFNVADCKLV